VLLLVRLIATRSTLSAVSKNLNATSSKLKNINKFYSNKNNCKDYKF
jgi:hypothetical protein